MQNSINGVLLDTGSNRQISIGTTIAPGKPISTNRDQEQVEQVLEVLHLVSLQEALPQETDNVAIGQDAGMNVTTGKENIMIGFSYRKSSWRNNCE